MPTSETDKTPEPALGDYLSIALAWLIPGAGHFAIGERTRGYIFAITIHAMFFFGWFLGGIRAINPPDQAIWSYTQFMGGWPMIVANMVQKQAQSGAIAPLKEDAPYAPKIVDPGSVYCGIAGMLNLLVMFDVLVRIGGGRGGPEPKPADQGGKQP